MSRTDKEGVNIRSSVLAEGNMLGMAKQALGATYTIPPNAPPFQDLDANGGARTVNLPSNSVKGQFILITNYTGAANSLTVKDFTSTTTVGVVAQNKAALFISNGDGTVNAWRVVLGS